MTGNGCLNHLRYYESCIKDQFCLIRLKDKDSNSLLSQFGAITSAENDPHVGLRSHPFLLEAGPGSRVTLCSLRKN